LHSPQHFLLPPPLQFLLMLQLLLRLLE